MKAQAAKKYKLQVVTQDRILLDQDVTYCVVPSAAGPLGILPGHAPLLGLVTIGALRVRDVAGQEFGVFVGRGFFMISNEGVMIAVEVAELENHIDVERARQALERASQILQAGAAGMEYEKAQDALMRSKSRLMVAEKRTA
jgi:F-type H+-transporting ATPase subunit epsilon